MKIADKSYVAMDYVLTIDSGEEIDRSGEGEPLGFITGANQIIPGLERALMGMTAGEEAEVTVKPEEAYGAVREELMQRVSRDRFPADSEIKPGMSFQAQGPKGPFMITVAALNDDETVTVDLNHPLAGKELNFAVKIVEVREPSPAEIAQLSASAGCGCGSGPETESDCGPGCQCG